MCDCFHLAFPNWHAASSGTAGRRLPAPEPTTEDDSLCEEQTQFTEEERPRPQGSSPVQEFPEAAKYSEGEKEFQAEHDPQHKTGSGHKGKKSGLGSMFERTSTPKMSKSKEAQSPECGIIVNAAKGGCAEGLVYSGGGKEGIFIKTIVPESPASKSLEVKEGDQILSATVYFDNMSYEDAIQILEHAQAYKMKLCIKRQPDITESESTIESDAIPEEDVCSTEMRVKGKSRRRGDARISWPKFSSFGKGRKSRFTRSHSSSEADEQRKLELSPATSDTESPIKSQDALKGKKKHKIKLSTLTKRGRISSSEDQDTDVPITRQISGDTQLKQESDTLSPECTEYPLGETLGVNIEAGKKSGEVKESELQGQKTSDTQNLQLISIENTLKSTDSAVALTDQGNQILKSPEEKNRKKERSELKMKFLGKDKSHKKEPKAKSSPKRLKTLGASVDTEDLPVTGSNVITSSESKTKLLGDQTLLGVKDKSQSSESLKVTPSKSMTSQISLPKVELDISVRKSPKKGDEKTQKAKDHKQKQSKKSSPKRKQPEADMSDVPISEEMQKVNDQESTNKTGRVSTTQLPKREDIEIPGMEDISMKTAKIKETKADFKKDNKENQSETVQMSIDVNSVKEAVSKLPGFKLPQVDICGMPIREEITVIDANAQRISVKTPTKVTKKSDITASSEISKTMFLTENNIDFNTSQKDDNTSPTGCNEEQETMIAKTQHIVISGKELYTLPDKDFDRASGKGDLKLESESAATKESVKTRPKITMPSFGMSSKSRRLPYIGIDSQKQTLIQEKDLNTETRKDERKTGEVICKVEIPEPDGFEYIDSTDESSVRKDGLKSFDISADVKGELQVHEVEGSGSSTKQTFSSPEIKISTKDVKGSSKFKMSPSEMPRFAAATPNLNTDVSDTKSPTNGVTITSNIPETAVSPSVDVKTKVSETEGRGSKFKIPKFGISLPKLKGHEIDETLLKKAVSVDVTLPKGQAEAKLLDAEHAESGIMVEEKVRKMGFDKDFEYSTSKPEIGTSYSEAKAELKLSESTGENIVLAPVALTRSPEAEIQTLKNDNEFARKEWDVQLPKIGIEMPKLNKPEFSLGHSGKSVDVITAEEKAQLKNTETMLSDTETKIKTPATKVNVSLGKAEILIPTGNVEVGKPEVQTQPLIEGQGSRFKMPTLGITMPKIKASETKKDVEGIFTESKTDVKILDAGFEEQNVEQSSSKFKMPTFKLPKLGLGTPRSTTGVYTLDKEAQRDGVDLDIPDEVLAVTIVEPRATDPDNEETANKFKMQSLSLTVSPIKGQQAEDIVTQQRMKSEEKKETEGSPSRFKMPTFKFPKFGVSSPTSIEKVPPLDKDVKTGEGDTTTTGEILAACTEEPSINIKEQSAHLKTIETVNEERGRTFNMPSLGFSVSQTKGPDTEVSLSSTDVDVTVPEIKMEAKLPEERFNKSIEVEAKAPEIKGSKREKEGSPSRFKMPTFKWPQFGASSQSSMKEVPPLDKDFNKGEGDSKISGEILAVSIEEPGTDAKGPSAELKTIETENEGKGRTFKLPSLGFSVSQTKGADTDITLSTSEVDVALAETEAKLPEGKLNQSIEFEAKAPEIKGSRRDKEGSPSRFKMPTFKLPKFGASSQSSNEEVLPLDKDIKTGDNITSGEILEAGGEGPDVDIRAPSADLKTKDVENEGKGKTFKLPSLGFSVSQTKGPDTEISLSTTDVDVTLPDIKMDAKLPEEKINKSFEMEAKVPEINVTREEKTGSPSKFKMPTFKLPKYGAYYQSSNKEIPPLEKDVRKGEADSEVLAGSGEGPSIDIKAPSGEVKISGAKGEISGGKFKLPSLGFSVSETKGPDTELSLSTKDVDVTGPEVKVEAELPKGKMIKPTEFEAKAAELKDAKMETEGSPSRFKMPTFRLPKFGTSYQISTEKGPPLDKNVKTEEGDTAISGEIFAASTEEASIDIKELSAELKTTETEKEERGRKFKLPSLGFSVSQTKGADTEISLSSTDVEVTVPEVTMEAKLPAEKFDKISESEPKVPEYKGIKKETEASPSKVKMPNIKLPTLGLSFQSSTEEAPPLDKKITKGEGDSKMSGEIFAASGGPSIDIKAPSATLKPTGVKSEISGGKFKLPSLGFSVSQTKGADTEISLSPTDVGATEPRVKVEAELPEEVEVKGLELKSKKTDGSPSRFKMPTFKLPKFGTTYQSSTEKGPLLDKDVKMEGSDTLTSGDILASSTKKPEEPSINVKEPLGYFKTIQTENEGRKFKLPSLGFSVSQTKEADTEISLSTTDVDVTVPEVQMETQLTEDELNKTIEFEAKAPEIKGTRGEKDGSPSRFKMPTFKWPKFGASSQSSTEEVPHLDKDVITGGGDNSTTKEIRAAGEEGPSIDIEEPSADLKRIETENEGKGRTFKLPSLGFSVSQTKGPDTEMNLSTIDADVKNQDLNMEAKLPEKKINTSIEMEAKPPEIIVTRREKEGSPSKFKMPTLKLPRFGSSSQSSNEEVPSLDRDVRKGEDDSKTSGEILEPDGSGPNTDIEAPSAVLKSSEAENQIGGGKFKLPSLGFSATQTKSIDTEITLSTTDVDVTLPDLKIEAKLLDEKLSKSSEVEAKAPEFKGTKRETEGSPSRFKMPTFKLPRFGLSSHSSTQEVTSLDKDLITVGGETTGTEEVTALNIEGQNTEIRDPSMKSKTEESESEGKGKKFKLPSLGFSVTQAKVPDMDFSLKTDIDVTQQQAEIKMSDNELKIISTENESKEPKIQGEEEEIEESTSKFKMKTFKFPKLGLTTQSSSEEVPSIETNTKTGRDETTAIKEVVTVPVEGSSMEIEGMSADLSNLVSEHEERGLKLKLPSLSFSVPQAKRPDIDLSLKTDADVRQQEGKAEGDIAGDKLKKSSIEVETKPLENRKNTEGSPSKFKMPNFKFPKFGLATQSAAKEASPFDKSVEIKEGERTTSEDVIPGSMTEPSRESKSSSLEPKTEGNEGKGRQFKLPSLGFSVAEAKGADTDLELSKRKVAVTLPEVKAEVKLSDDDELKKTSTPMHTEGPEISLPKFGIPTYSTTDEGPPFDRDEEETKTPDIKLVPKDSDGSPSRFKMPTFKLPKLGLATHSSNKQEPDLNKTVKDESTTLEEVLTVTTEGPCIEIKGPSTNLQGSETDKERSGRKFVLPSLGFSVEQGKAGNTDINLSNKDINVEIPKAVTSTETKICQSDADVKESTAVPIQEASSTVELDTNLKKSKFSLPKFSFSKSSIKKTEVKAELPDPGEVKTETITEVKLSADEEKQYSTIVETTAGEAEVRSKGSPLKFKMPTLKMPKFGSASYEVTTETHSKEKKAEYDGSELEEDSAVIIKSAKMDVEIDASKSAKAELEPLKTESGNVVHGSSSKFKLPSFNIPQLSLLSSKLEDETVQTVHEDNKDQLQMKIELKEENVSPKLTLKSTGDSDFDVPKVYNLKQNTEISKEPHEPVESATKHTEQKEDKAKSKQDATKSPERTSWFRFPKFGLSSPKEQRNVPDKAEKIEDCSPVGETRDDEGSSPLSVQSSDAFADISSTITSEPVGPFIPSPTKGTVQHFNDTTAAGLEEIQVEVRSELIADVPNMPEKINILSSGVSSSSDDTVRLKSGKIHIITSNIQATPESQHAKLVSAVSVQPAEGLTLQSKLDEAQAWIVQDSQSATKTVFEKHLVQQTSTETSKSKETLVITKQITHIFGTAEHISGDTASSIQRLKDSVHSEKMRFFDEAEK
ncbi:neuroblast differentiation-associated protein AHNAK-like isoform X1 [Cyprinodon tularosa]|uniref:neuroblast differentiation-associated protein AHNAK-like isoform X1 n=1 Tax=Cyprinodon tularosa TaxID=77115 RepID=UPI0018E28F71|nr:neuroblast differentiation-associated protein AHNAK-like isoform X1 [Cyprinodon tularosa]